MSPTAFIAMLLPTAQACMREFGVPVSVSLAQAAAETGWGQKVVGNNLYGIKADDAWCKAGGPVCMIHTHEEFVKGKPVPVFDKFRLYKSWNDSVRDHAKFLAENPRYKPAFATKTGTEFARAVAAAGYATGSGYSDLLANIIKGRRLEDFDKCEPPKKSA